MKIENDATIKNILEKAFILHKIKDNKIVFSKSMSFIYKEIFNLENKKRVKIENENDIFSYFFKISLIKVKNKAHYFMGTRMGRPEKSERKSMKGIHTLFPLSDKVGSSRLVEKAIEMGKVKIDVCRKKCPKCGTVSILNTCPKCAEHAEIQIVCTKCKNLYPTSQ